MLTRILPRWVGSNGLALNLKKTKYMLFSRSKTELQSPPTLCNKAIERESESSFLGVIVNAKLTRAKHIQAVRSKMLRYIGIMYKLKKVLPLRSRIQIYDSFVQSPFFYPLASKAHIDGLFANKRKL